MKQTDSAILQENSIQDIELNENDVEAVSDKGETFSTCGGRLRTLILTPTRELALQVHKCLDDIAKVLSINVGI